jgi:hypothetical protein
MKVPETVAKAVGEKAGGGRPSAMSAAFTAVAVGAAVGVTVYRALRS